MTPIPGKPLFGAHDYKKYGNIIIDDFIIEFKDGWRTWICDKCENYGSGVVESWPDDRDQLMLFDVPFEQTDHYKFTYFMAQKHYEWCHKGEYRTTDDQVKPSPEFQKIVDDAYLEAAIEHDQALDAIWFPTEPVSKWQRFKAYFGFESYHGKHRQEDFEDVAARREVRVLWNAWHRTVTTEYRHYPLSTWQGRQCFQSDIQLARGYYPFKRKRHRKC